MHYERPKYVLLSMTVLLEKTKHFCFSESIAALWEDSHALLHNVNDSNWV
jgi:hypothetical protein